MSTPWLGYWPDPSDAPAVEPRREAVTLTASDGAVVRGILWTPSGGTPWRTAVVPPHQRGERSTRCAAGGATAVALGNSGGGSLMALAQAGTEHTADGL